MSDAFEHQVIHPSAETQALQRIESAPAVGGVFQDMAMVETLLSKAVDSKAAVEVLVELNKLRVQVKAERAKEAFYHAMEAFQAECPPIKKDEAVWNKDRSKGIRYHYAPLESIIAQTKELIKKHGFSYKADAKACELPVLKQPGVLAVCKVTHTLGHSEESSFEVPIDPEAYMNAAQKFASAFTFAKRYAFCAAFGIMTEDSDDDGAGTDPEHAAGQGKKPPTSPVQASRPNPAPSPAPANKPAESPTPAPSQTQILPTEAFRKRTIEQLQAGPGGQFRKLVRKFLDKCGNILLPNNELEEWPLQYIPVDKEQFEALRGAITRFESGEEAKFPFHNPMGIGDQAPAEKPKAEKPKKPVEVPRDPDAGDQSTPPTQIDPNWEFSEGRLEQVSVKDGTNRRGPYTKYGLKLGGEWHNTFSKRIGSESQAAKKQNREVRIYWTAGEYGRDVQHLELL